MNLNHLNKIVDQLVSETIIESNGFYTSFFFSLSSRPRPILSSRPTFSDHCRDIYGLDEQEIEYVWEQYKKIIKDMIKDKNNLNESTGDKKYLDKFIYLDKVVDQLVKETIIESNNIYVPFLPSTSYPFSPAHFSFSLSNPHFHILYTLFSSYVTKIYGLNEEETEYVWKQYKDIIKDKIKKQWIRNS